MDGISDFDPCECSRPTWATCTKPIRERERNMCQESASILVLLSATSQKMSQETIQSAQGISKKIHGMAFFFVFFELWLIFVPSKDLLVQLLVEALAWAQHRNSWNLQRQSRQSSFD